VSNLLDIIRYHLQEVLSELNEGNTFEKLNTASPLEKEVCFMDIYFNKIRTALLNSATPPPPPSPPPPPQQQQQSPVPAGPRNPQQQQQQQRSQQSIRREIGVPSIDGNANNIWCALVFRMLCWLMLHDFHKKDVQIPKGELLGSRLPVYIA
jgi:hypothetical protein